MLAFLGVSLVLATVQLLLIEGFPIRPMFVYSTVKCMADDLYRAWLRLSILRTERAVVSPSQTCCGTYMRHKTLYFKINCMVEKVSTYKEYVMFTIEN